MDEYFGGHVFGSADEAEGSGLIFLHSLAGAHVDELEVAVAAHHDVFGFEVAVDDAFLVKHLHHVDQQRDVEPCLIERQNADGPDDVE